MERSKCQRSARSKELSKKFRGRIEIYVDDCKLCRIGVRIVQIFGQKEVERCGGVL